MTLPFFVYGTLRPGEVNHDLFLRGRTHSEEPGRLADAVLYEGSGYPYAVEEPGGGAVGGELVTALPEAYEGLLAELDRMRVQSIREESKPDNRQLELEAAERQKVRAEISTMVSEKPDEVAAMLRGWLSENKSA